MTGWGINPDYKVTANEAAEGEYMFTGLNLTPTDEFKVVYSEGLQNRYSRRYG